VESLSDFFSANYRYLEIATAFVAVVVLISSIDDLFIDVRYWVREIWRKLKIWPRYKALTPEQLRAVPEKPIAIMVPAWQEYDVIASMIENMVATLEYREFMVFVGTYPNDQRTIDEVERMRRRYKQLVRVPVPHDGPTCKADCLNWIVQSIEQTAKTRGIEFAGMVLHDSEDVLHPLELQILQLPAAAHRLHSAAGHLAGAQLERMGGRRLWTNLPNGMPRIWWCAKA
jgi:adsorption protein B